MRNLHAIPQRQGRHWLDEFSLAPFAWRTQPLMIAEQDRWRVFTDARSLLHGLVQGVTGLDHRGFAFERLALIISRDEYEMLRTELSASEYLTYFGQTGDLRHLRLMGFPVMVV